MFGQNYYARTVLVIIISIILTKILIKYEYRNKN